MNEWSRGDWMQTYTGKQFYPMDPKAEDIDPLDIAHSLSLQCRYNGHIEQFYSVAEHCVLMSEVVPEKDMLWALLHDATEAYVGDMIRPLKLSMPEFRETEDRVMAKIVERFDLHCLAMPESVHVADARILLTERNALMQNTLHRWSQENLKPLEVQIEAWSPMVSQEMYLKRMKELGAE